MASVQSHHVLSHICSECILTRTASSYLYSLANCMIIGFDRAKTKLPGLLMNKHPNLTRSLNYLLSNWCYRLNIATAVSVKAGDDTFDISSSSLCAFGYINTETWWNARLSPQQSRNQKLIFHELSTSHPSLICS